MNLTLKFDLLLKSFNLAFELQGIVFSYCTGVFLVTRPFTWYHNFWLRDLDLEVWPTCENLNLGCYLMMVAARRASLSSDNSYFFAVDHCRFISHQEHYVIHNNIHSARCWTSSIYVAIYLVKGSSELLSLRAVCRPSVSDIKGLNAWRFLMNFMYLFRWRKGGG